MNRRTFFGRLAGVAAAMGIGSRVVKAEKSITGLPPIGAPWPLPGVFAREDGSRTLVALNPFRSRKFAHYECVIIHEQLGNGECEDTSFFGRIAHGPAKGVKVYVGPSDQPRSPSGHWTITSIAW